MNNIQIKLKLMRTFLFNICLLVMISSLDVSSSVGQPANKETNNPKNEIQYLSGIDKDNQVNWEFYCTGGSNQKKWTTIPVPSHWELHGFGTYNYGRENSTLHSDEEGFYRYKFKIRDGLKNKRIYIVFEGSMTDTEVKINGKSAGPIHQGAFYEFKYDITRLINVQTENLLEVTVRKKSSNESVNRAERYADYWIFGGIFRPVYLQGVPEQFIERAALNAKADGSFNADLYLNNIADANVIKAQIKDLKGRDLGRAFTARIKKGDTKVLLSTTIKDPLLWSAEFPNLYKVEFSLLKGTEVIHFTAEKFGFRTVELRPKDGIYVNGARIRMKGANRHSFWPSSGRTTSKALSIQDVNLMKEMNMNAVRMSHYPPDKHFLDVCDSLGLYVLDELAGWQNAYDTEVGKKLVKEMLIRDVNHPSIIIWDNGNEGGNNFELDDDFALYDPQSRPVIHPWNVFRNTDTQHYKPFDCCTGTLFHGKEVFFPTEFLHGLYDGGSGAGLDDYWNLMLKNPLSAGGFLWALVDEAVVRTDKNDVLDTHGNFAPDGIVGPYREKEGSYYAIKNIWSPVYLPQKILFNAAGMKVEVENRFDISNLNQCSFYWKLVKLPLPGDKAKEQKESKGTIAAPDLEPGMKGYLKFQIPGDYTQYDVLYIYAKDSHGREIYKWAYPVKSPKDIAETIVDKTIAEMSASIKEAGDLITMSANGVTIKIGKKNGVIQSIQNAKTPVSFNNGPVLSVGKSSITGVKYYADKKDAVLEFSSTGNLKKLQYRMLSSGWFKIDYEYIPTNVFDYCGVNFDYPEEKVTGIQWMGKGPYRVWKNRMKGVELDVWQKKYNNTITGRSWQYPEFKGYHSNMYWAVIENEEHPITIVSETEDIFLRLFTPAQPEDATVNTFPAFPTGSISFMNAISAIGDKFLKAEQLGPQSQQNIFKYSGNQPYPLTGSLYFNFGAGLK